MKNLYILFSILFISLGCTKDEIDQYTEDSGIIIDERDGYEYQWVKIGKQIWMAENLITTKYRNGDPIPNVIEDNIWRILDIGAYCNYNNDENLVNIYGRLYNWHAVNDKRGLCPCGWHVPSEHEWTTLTKTLGGEFVAGGKMKFSGITYWQAPNLDATNESGFNGLPGGLRNPGWGIRGNPDYDGDFKFIGEYGHWHTSTEYDSYNMNRRYLYYDNAMIGKWDSYPKESGLSVRCIKD